MTTTTDLDTRVMPEADARRLTERIRYSAMSVRDGMEKLQTLVAQAQEGNAHLALGYASWTAYLADVLGEEPLRLPRDERRELVSWLAGEGMSTRAIAPIVGADQKTISNDLRRAREEFSSPESAPSAPTPETPQGEDAPWSPAPRPAEPTAVTGLDGKTYTRPEPAAPRTAQRRALPDQFFDATFDLTKAVEKVARLTEDDRYPQNAEKVAAKHRSDLIRTRDLLQEVINRLPSA